MTFFSQNSRKSQNYGIKVTILWKNKVGVLWGKKKNKFKKKNWNYEMSQNSVEKIVRILTVRILELMSEDAPHPPKG